MSNAAVSARAGAPALLAPRTLSCVRAAVFALCLVPFSLLAWRTLQGELGANPVEAILRFLGTWTLVLLLVTLSITPLRRLTGWSWMVRLRRMLGLYAFFYATLHVVAWVWLDHWFDWSAMVEDVVKRPYLTFGFLAFVGMLPLAATSTQAMMRRLGRRWQQLHRIVYAIAVLGVLHFVFHKLAKNDLAQPLIYASVLAVLLGARIVHAWRVRSSATPLRRG